MAITSTTVLDLVGQTQALSYYNGATLIDQITFSSNSITFAAISPFSLSKSDTILYNTFLQTFYTALLFNFPSVQKTFVLALPISNFQVSRIASGGVHIQYIQTSGSAVLTIDFAAGTATAAFSGRSAITITLQEFSLTQYMLQKFDNQVALH